MTTQKAPEYSTILFVCDAANDLDLLFDYLRGFGFKVLIAHNGEAALAIAEFANPDIILLEVMISDMDGFEICRRLKANRQTKNVPVIFIATVTNAVDKVRGFSLGAVDYITKPFQAEEVLARVRTHLTIQNLQKSLAEKNARLEEEIAARERLIGELDAFAHTVAHDLKNPLGVTINYAQLLKNYRDRMPPEQLHEAVDSIARNGRKMNSIINELLLLSSVRKEEVELEPVEMSQVVTEAQDRLTYMIQEAQAEFIIPDHWPRALGYAPWIEEVWANYLSNAIKYGGTPPRVELGATPYQNGMIKFWVRDNGQGLTRDQQSRLFIPFTRLDQARTEGHGLGLSIVQRIVEKLGGKVGVESEGIPGQGSVFSFFLAQAPNGDITAK